MVGGIPPPSLDFLGGEGKSLQKSSPPPTQIRPVTLVFMEEIYLLFLSGCPHLLGNSRQEIRDEGAEGDDRPEPDEQEPGQDVLGDLQQPQHQGHTAGLHCGVDWRLLSSDFIFYLLIVYYSISLRCLLQYKYIIFHSVRGKYF